MSNIISRIHDDIDDYLTMCERYGEKPETDKSGVNPYGEHARKLRERLKKEWEAGYE